MSWTDFLAATEAITAQYIPLYERIGELDPSEREPSSSSSRTRRHCARSPGPSWRGTAPVSLDAITALAHMR